METILITGGNGGLAVATARVFLERDSEAHVWLGVRARRDQAAALSLEFPDRCVPITLDVTQEEDWEKAMKLTGPLRILINNAGKNDDSLLAHMSVESWRGTLETHLTGAWLGSRAVLPGMMRARYGRIVQVSSLSALLSPAGQTNYAAAKAGLHGLAQSLSKEAARFGVTVNCICPGYIETGSVADMDPETRKAAVRTVPMRRFARAEEIAHAIRFLASPEASYITGATLKADGGIL